MSNTESESLRSEPPAVGPVTYGNAAVHRMIELYESGMSLRDVGLQVNRNPSTVYRVLRMHGVEFRSNTTSDSLTPIQDRVLGFIESYLATRGFPPNVREISEATGLESTASVVHQLLNLERLGRISRARNVARGIAVLRGSGES